MNEKQALVVDDHPIVRHAIKDLLGKSFPTLEIRTSSGHGDVLEQVCGTRWAFVVLDINLPGVNGLDIIKQAKVRQSRSPIIVYSLYSEAQYAGRALRAGATAYLSKDRSPMELVKLITEVLRGKTIEKPMVEKPVLSDREMQILTRLAKGMKRTVIAADLGINAKTVSTYQSRLLYKLELRNVVELVRYAVEEGLVE